jgi:ATP-binding cassette subfamily C protein
LRYAEALGASGYRVTLAWQAGRTACRLVMGAALAIFAGAMIEAGALDPTALAWSVAALGLAGVAGLAAERCAARAEASVATGLRTAIERRLAAEAAAIIVAQPAGALIAGLQRQPDAVAALVIGHRAATTMLALGPLLAAAAIACVAWQAALALVVATPVMILFFILAGGMIEARAHAQETAFGRLASQFADRMRAMPTILANHGLAREHGKLGHRLRAYADGTVKLLTIAFLNAGIIDFFTSLSIAILAVFLGLAHLKLIALPGLADLQLWQSLFILLLAPEYFAPFRRYAENYHAKAEGAAAARAIDWLFEPGVSAKPAATAGLPADGACTITLPHVGKTVTIDLPPRGLVAVTGPSGAGKSTLLRILAEIETPGADAPPFVSPSIGAGAGATGWASTDIYVPGGTLAEVLSWRRAGVTPAALQTAAARLGLLDDALLPGGLTAAIADGGENLSGGQRMRIGIARIMLGAGPAFADEPTAKLDPLNAARVRQALAEIAGDRLVIVATHDDELAALASRRIDLGGGMEVHPA